MKTALITTTINVPTVLALYRKLAPFVDIIVAGDRKTPPEAIEFCSSIGAQYVLGEPDWESTEATGWNTDSRRNIALLYALKSGVDFIISIDDDMIPYDVYFPQIFAPFNGLKFSGLKFSGLKFGDKQCWFDAGEFTLPSAPQRGLPADALRFANKCPEPIVNAQIGVVQGIILGTPDTSAANAIAKPTMVHSASDILRNGFVVDQEAYTVFNSQFTAFRRELAPAFAQFYAHQGRNTDILASVLMRRIMRELNLYTYFGPPMGFHARQPRPLFKDLKAEMFGLEHIDQFTRWVDGCDIRGLTIVDACRKLVIEYAGCSREMELVASAWYRDCEKVL